MGSERNTNFPNGVDFDENGNMRVYYSGYGYRKGVVHALDITTQSNGYGDEIVYLLNPKAPIAVWQEYDGPICYDVRLFLGRHSKQEEGFCLYPVLKCGNDAKLGDYTEAWSVTKS